MSVANERNEVTMTLSIKEVTRIVQSIGANKTFNVTFVKKDGTERTFFGCTMEQRICDPQDEKPTNAVELPPAVPVKTVDGWRSFRTDSVLDITV